MTGERTVGYRCEIAENIRPSKLPNSLQRLASEESQEGDITHDPTGIGLAPVMGFGHGKEPLAQRPYDIDTTG